MKKLLLVLPALALTIFLTGQAKAAFEEDVDYSSLMITAALAGDYEAGVAARNARSEKITALETGEIDFSFEDLYLLSKIIYAEAGSEWLSDEWKMCVGEVVMNRVASSEFPDTVKEVLQQPGQYYGANSRYFTNLKPSERTAQCALRLLKGERLLEPSVVFQANFKQGGGTHTAVYDRYLGWTYFCYSAKTELYQ